MQLEPVEYIQGTMSLILIIISFMVSIKLFLRYKEFHIRESLLVGFTWIGIVSPWIPDTVSFIMILTVGFPLTVEAVFLIGYAPIPIYILCWMSAFSESLYKEKKKYIMIFCIVFSTFFELVFLYLLFTDIESLGTRIRPFQMRFNTFMMIYLFALILIILITGILFARVAFITDNREVNLKGMFLFAAFLSFTIGAIIEALFHITPILIIFTRSILISSAFEFYCGFALPERIKKFFLKDGV